MATKKVPRLYSQQRRETIVSRGTTPIHARRHALADQAAFAGPYPPVVTVRTPSPPTWDVQRAAPRRVRTFVAAVSHLPTALWSRGISYYSSSSHL